MRSDSFLFVYGTLKRGCKGRLGTLQRRRLSAGSVFVGSACVDGRLFDLGRYPGLKVPSGAVCQSGSSGSFSRGRGKVGGNRVRGEVVRLLSAHQVFSWLDLYEGVAPSAGGLVSENQHIYRRVVGEAELDLGQRLLASMYVIKGPVGRCKLISGGCWSG